MAKESSMGPCDHLRAIGNRLDRNGVDFNYDYEGGGAYKLEARDRVSGQSASMEVSSGFRSVSTARTLLMQVSKPATSGTSGGPGGMA